MHAPAAVAPAGAAPAEFATAGAVAADSTGLPAIVPWSSSSEPSVGGAASPCVGGLSSPAARESVAREHATCVATRACGRGLVHDALLDPPACSDYDFVHRKAIQQVDRPG